MQDRYAGDVGDFVKLGLLRAISPASKLGVIWYRFPDENHNGDGRHISYLSQPERFACLDKPLFEHLKQITGDSRAIAALLPVLPDAMSFDDSVDFSKLPPKQRSDAREAWFSRALDAVSGCDVVFADPDNGIVDDAHRRRSQAKFGKQIPLCEVKRIAAERCAIIYHHNTRRAGGHDAEVDFWREQLNMPSIAVRANAFSARTFFVINADANIRQRVGAFCDRWAALKVKLHRE